MKAPAMSSLSTPIAEVRRVPMVTASGTEPLGWAIRGIFGLAVAALLAAAPLAHAQTVRPVVANTPATGAAPIEPQSTLNPPAAVMTEPASNTLLAELRGLVEKRSVLELRTTYNGQYGASLLFKPDDLQYYVALFQQRQFWRAIKTADYAQAEKLYRSFATQTEDLAKVDIERIRLDAERSYTEQRIEREAAELASLRNNLDYQRQREREVLVAQEQAREQARLLATQERAARLRLEELQQSIRTLESQQNELLRTEIAPRRGN